MDLGPFSKLIPFIIALIFMSLTLLLLNKKSQPKPHQNDIHQHQPIWYDILMQEFEGEKIKIGVVNMDDGVSENYQLHGLAGAETVTIHFDRVDKDHQWSDFFPKRIDEYEKEGPSSCPEIPMPKFEDYHGLNVIVARVACKGGAKREGVKDVFRLQLNLVVANLLVSSGWENHNHQVDQMVYVVFIGSCGPMREIFRCEDLLVHEDDFFVYKPNLRKLKQVVLMPVGTCQFATPYEESGEEMRRTCELSKTNNTPCKPREAYVTLLHSDSFVCGAIALAQSIIQTNTTKDLVLLADDSLSKMSRQGLRAAGWKIKHIELIQSPHVERKVYSEWSFSKLHVWQLTEYDKILYIDADAIVLENIDEFFFYPQLSVVGDADDFVFNAGVMLVEPSKCTFETLIEKMFKVPSYDAGDQGFLNEMFAWWHRWPSTLNRLKVFDGIDNKSHVMPGNPRVIHYVGLLKPWMCQTDYDCSWDVRLHKFASDSVHQRWLQVYKALPKRLQVYCELTKRYDPTLVKIRKWVEDYKDASSLNGNRKIYLIIVLLFIFFLLLLFNDRSLNLIWSYGSCMPMVRRKEKVKEEECHDITPLVVTQKLQEKGRRWDGRAQIVAIT